MKEIDELVAYRHRTVIFGLGVYPFILYYVIKHHGRCYNDDECSCVLLANFYADNLIVTGNLADVLAKAYAESLSHMNEGRFSSDSWILNMLNHSLLYKRMGLWSLMVMIARRY